MRARNPLPRLAVVVLLLCAAGAAFGFPSVARKTKMSCATCHGNVAGGTVLTDAGKAYKADNTKVPAATVAGADYVGSNKCKMCHLKQHKAWGDSKHARALETLRTADAKVVEERATALGVKLTGPAVESAECLTCHTVGYQLGGYPPSDTLKVVSFGAMGCEMCHGPGSKHVAAEKAEKKNFINVPKTEAMCKDCHTAAMSPKFAYDEYKKTGVHVVPTTP